MSAPVRGVLHRIAADLGEAVVGELAAEGIVQLEQVLMRHAQFRQYLADLGQLDTPAG